MQQRNSGIFFAAFAAIAGVAASPSLSQGLHLEGLDQAMRSGEAQRVTCPKPERLFVGKDADRKLPVGSDSLVDLLYEELRARAVVESGTCRCDLWRPSWQAAVDLYNTDYAGIDGNDLLEAQNGAMERGAPLFAEASRLCRSQGIY